MDATVTKLEPRRKPRVARGYGGAGLTKRVEALEGRMIAVEQSVATAAAKATEAADNTAALLGIATAARGTAAFARKHGPRLVAFVTGTLAAAGVGNPQVWKFVGNFFGG